MTGDLGPERIPDEDLASVFEPYLLAAAGLAAERGEEDASAVLQERVATDVAFADAPLSAAGGVARASVEVRLRVPDSDLAGTGGAVAALLNEVAAGDGFRVQRVEILQERPSG